jgi:O-antigen/teichoic acid export membrane protein
MLKNIKELGKDSFFYGSSTIIGQLASLILVPYFSQELLPAEYGLLNMIALISVFISPIIGLGFDTSLFRFYSLANSETEKAIYYSVASFFKFFSVLFFIIFLYFLYSLINKFLFEGILTKEIFNYFLISLFFENINSLAILTLRSERKVKRMALYNILFVIYGLIFSIYFVLYLKMGVKGAVLATLISTFIKFLMYLPHGRKIFSLKLISLKFAKEMLVYSLPLVPHKIQSNLINLFTAFMINQKLGLLYSGYYAIASKVGKPLSFIVSMVQQSWTPYKYHLHKQENQKEKTFSELIFIYWVFLLLLWVANSFLAPYVFDNLIDKKFSNAVYLVPFILLFSLSHAFYFTITTGFELSKNQKYLVKASFLGAIFLIVSSFLTINWPQPYTFILLQPISYIIFVIVIFPKARDIIKIKYYFKESLFLIIISAIIIFLGYLKNNSLVYLILLIAHFSICFFILKKVIPRFKFSSINSLLKNK